MQEDEINDYNNVNDTYASDYKTSYEHLDAISKPGIAYQGRIQHTQRFMPLTQIYSDDMRISRILRRLLGEQQPTQAVEICDKLETAIRSPSNAAYICRSFEMLVDQLTQILKQCPIEIVQQVSNILGLIGYINRTNFPIYKNYLTKTYQNSKSLRKYLMTALKMTFRCDAVNLDLMVYSKRMLEVLIDYLENADKADTFIAISDTVSEFSKHYSIAFAEKFTDIVDIVVGWHLETDQPQSLKLHCATLLQLWAAYFLNELDFTYGLLGQFLEDITAWLDDLTTEGATKKARHKAELRIASFIGAFTTILKSLVTPTEFVGVTADPNFAENAVLTIFKAAKEAFTLKSFGEEITVNVNDFLSLLLAYSFKFKNISDVDGLLKLQLDHLSCYNEQQIGSLLYVIICYVRHQRTALSCSFLSLLLNSETNREFSALKLTKNECNYKLYLKMYHEILLLKNVPLLQEAYKHIKADIHSSMECICLQPAKDNANLESSVQIINFYLSALSVLATQTSSIISMYALDPSILELLIHNCKASDVVLWSKAESCLHNALLKLLALHCQRNNNFATTSRLLHDQPDYTSQVLEEQIRNSPTSEHFTQILKFFDAGLKQADKLTTENLRLLLDWLEQIIEVCKQHFSVLCKNSYFLSITRSLGSVALYAPLESAKCMQALLLKDLPSESLAGIKSTAIYMLSATDPNIQTTYANLLGMLPVSVTLQPTEQTNDHGTLQLKKIGELKKWYQGTPHYAPLRAKYFKEFLEYFDFPFLKKSSLSDDIKNKNILENIFAKCFIEQANEEHAAEYQYFARRHTALVVTWIQCEAARYCVRNKLRTTVGKPQETFLAIEAIVIKYARLLSSKHSNDIQNESNSICIGAATDFQHCAHLLLGFLEALEKQIYNAAHGTAFAMPSVEKPAKTFFRINASTCNEWFKRIRPGVCLIAAHCMEPEMAIRYTEQTLEKVNQLSSTLLESTIINLVQSLLACNEAESLSGLYAWIRNQTGKSYAWIQCAADQASGHLEQAASRYKDLVDENHMRLDSQIKQFVLDQLIYCLYFTGQWKELKGLLEENVEEGTSQNALSLLNNAKSFVHLDTMDALCFGQQITFEQQSEVVLSEDLLNLMDWSAIVDKKNYFQNTTNILPNYSNYNILQSLEDIFIVETLKLQQIPHAVSSGVKNALQANLRELAGSSFSGLSVGRVADYLLLNHFYNNVFTKSESIEDANFDDLKKLFSENIADSSVLLKCMLWSLLIQQRCSLNGEAVNSETAKASLYLDLAAKARQDGNTCYSRKMLTRFFDFKGLTEPLVNISQKLLQREQVIDIYDVEFLRAISELSKCTYATAISNQSNVSQNEAINLASVLCLQIVEKVEEEKQENLVNQSIGAQTLRCLADWLVQNPTNAANYATLDNLPQLRELLEKLPEPLLDLSDKKLDESVPNLDKAVGKLYNASTLQQTDVADAWLAYGNWCYRWGKKLVEIKNSEHQALSSKNSENELSERDVTELGHILKHNFSQQLLSEISQVLQRHQFSCKIDAADDDLDANFTGSALELIEQELRQIEDLQHLSSDDIMDIIRIWRRTHKTVYAYYESSIRAYLKYLTLKTSNSCSKSIDDDCGFVTTTLRILRLVVKHAFALQEVLESGLNTTPLRPWKVIIPQLFSRLNHHEPYVRSSLAQLLCRLARDEPHAVIFPAIVGSQQENLQKETPSFNEDNLTKKSSTNSALSNCFSSLVSKLTEQAPQTVRHVQLLVRELRRVALLGEEYWLHALGRLLTEYSSLFSTLAMEMRKCNRSNAAQMEKLKIKHELLLQYVVIDLQKIISHTDKPAETKYEQCFKSHYESHIQQTLNKLSEPEIIVNGGPVESWQLLKNLYQRFQQRSMHALSTAGTTLKISDLSYTLGNMRDTAISMPGVAPKRGAPVYIRAIENTVHILPTKTRPKKLVFLGSDGQKYTYLFKGLEDLHLDERIMQFLSISNLMMQRTRERKHSQTFRAHYYSVIPLGPQSGLISWVDGVTPLFAIYKKWQQRDAALKQQQNKEQQQQQQDSPASQQTALRPSELFYKKLRPLLTAQNIKLKDSRKQWPLSILRRVLDELAEETPNDLLSKELWCHATSASEWHNTVRCYTISTAVMSVIGYIIGLGDRHLDNVLINLYTGEIVHIDYNVCFEKGKTLRVPEKVPFRMTPNFENALGVVGVEGAFRLGCEYVLKTLRKDKETLLTLLEAFVYDPLVDWTVSDEGISGGTTRSTLAYAAMQSVTSIKPGSNSSLSVNALTRESPIRINKQFEMVQRRKEWEIMQQTIKTRFEDIRNPWMEYVDEIEQSLQKIENVKEQLKTNLKSMNQIDNERNKLNQQAAIIREMEMLGTAIGSHSLNTITQRFQAYKQDAESLALLRKNAATAQKDIENLVESYFRVVIGEENELIALKKELVQYENTVHTNEFESMRPYIEQISSKVYEDISFARKEMDNSLQQESRTAMECIKILLEYNNIMKFYPRKKLSTENGLFRYTDWYRQLWLEGVDLNKLKTEVEHCRQIDSELQIISKQDKKKIAQYAGLLEKTLYEINMKSHQTLMVEENLRQQQQQSNVKIIMKEILELAALDDKTRATLQVAILQLLTDTSKQLESEENAQNLSKEIDFIQITELIFEHLELAPNCAQQLSEQKMLKALERTLKALNDLEEDFGFEFIVELFFKDDDIELQHQLLQLCKADVNSLQMSSTNRNLNTLLKFLNDKFEIIETEFTHLQQTVQEILDVDTCSWFNILLERLCVVRSLKNCDLQYWRNQTVFELFCLARELVESLKNNRIEMIYDVRLLYSSIQTNVIQLYSKYLKGLTLALSEAYISSFQTNMIYVGYGENNNAARLLCKKLLTVLQNDYELSQLQKQIVKNNKVSENFTCVASAYVWLNHKLLEDMLPNLTHIVPKESLLTNLCSLKQSLSAWKHTIVKIQDDINQHTTVLQQRLPWLVAGCVESEDVANQLMSKFEGDAAMQTLRYNFFLKLAVKLIENVNVLLQFESLVDDSITGKNTRRKAEAAFLTVLEEWQQTSNRYAQSSALITPVEKSIVELLDPEDKVDACWIANITGLLEELIFGVQKNLSSLEEACRNIQHRLYEYANDLQTLTDNPLRTDMRQLLRLIIKNARYPTKSSNLADETYLTNSARELLQLLKMLFGKLGELKTKLYLRENYDIEAIEQLDEKIKEARNALNQQHKELNALLQNYLEQSNCNTRSNSASPSRIASPAGERKDEQTMEKKGEQKRNAYAVSVWKRIRMKLEGRDPDANRRSSIAEQIDFIINEATNRDNLAVLYEGWTPWV